MIRIVNQPGLLVEEDRSSFLEGNAVLLRIGGSLDIIPFELKSAHAVVYLHRIYAAMPATGGEFQMPNVEANRTVAACG